MTCGTCGDRRLVIRTGHVNGFMFHALSCGNGHPWVPVPGEEYVLDIGEAR